MYKLSLALSFLTVSLSMGESPPTPSPPLPKPLIINPVEEFGKGMILGGQAFLCGVNSCNEDAVDKSCSIICDINRYIKDLNGATALSFVEMTYEAAARAVQIESKCLNTSYRHGPCDVSQPPDILNQVGTGAVRIGVALECVKNVIGQDLINVEEGVVEYYENFAKNDIGKGLKCPEVMAKGMRVFAARLENLCNKINAA